MVVESVTFALVTAKSILQNWTILVRKKYVSWRKNNTYNTWMLEAKKDPDPNPTRCTQSNLTLLLYFYALSASSGRRDEVLLGDS